MKSLEQKIKESLEQRRLSPSKEGWQSLENRLDQDERRPKRRLWWAGIAAAFLLGLFVAGLFKTTTRPTQEQPITTRLDEHPLLPDDGTLLKPIKIPLVEAPDIREAMEKERSVSSVQIDTPKGRISSPKPITRATDKSLTSRNLTQSLSEPSETKSKPGSSKSDQLHNTITEIAAMAKAKSKTHHVTDAEIGDMLRRAQFKVRAEKAFAESKNTVNAEVLLQEVEMELDKTLKERLFDAIHKGLNQAKSALASREN